MKKQLLLTAAMLLAALPASAQLSPQVSAARARGAVGERFDGYLGVAAPVDESTRRAVAVINIKRRVLYSDLAGRRGVSPQEVGITASCELMRRVGVGEAYLLNDGAWRHRAEGQDAPRPDYCR